MLVCQHEPPEKRDETAGTRAIDFDLTACFAPLNLNSARPAGALKLRSNIRYKNHLYRYEHELSFKLDSQGAYGELDLSANGSRRRGCLSINLRERDHGLQRLQRILSAIY